MGQEQFIGSGLGEVQTAEELAAFVAHCAYYLGNKEATKGVKLAAVSFFHQQYVG